jgi:hypothetical protein
MWIEACDLPAWLIETWYSLRLHCHGSKKEEAK